MSQLFINPYLNFSGHAREAMEFYHKALGGQLDLQAFDPNGAPKPAEGDDAIMHSRLEADGAIIMATDGMPGQTAPVGENVSIALGGTDAPRLRKIFAELSEGGKVEMPLKVESWGDEYGQFTDKFGIQWMVNISKDDSENEKA